MTGKVLAGVLMAAAFVSAQAAEKIAFEVASVKPMDISSFKMGNGGFAVRIGSQVEGDRVNMTFVSFADLVTQAYRLKSYQVTGPDWMTRERYEIHAKMPAGATKEQVPEMLQSLLADRFNLTFHRESKEHAVYALVAAKNGVKLKEVDPNAPEPEADKAKPGDPDKAETRTFTRVAPAGGAVSGGDGKSMVYATQSGSGGGAKIAMNGIGGTMHVDQKMTMPALCEMLGRFLDRPVLDMTELTKTYQVLLDLPMESLLKGKMAVVVGSPAAMGGGSSDGTASEPLDNSAVTHSLQQIGLKLEPRKAPIDLLVVEHAEKSPTEN